MKLILTLGHKKILAFIPLILSIGIVLALPSVEGAVEHQQITVQKSDLSYSIDPLTENQLEGCENIYEDYTTLEENVFNQRYLYHDFAGNCVMLFDDPVWETGGVYRYDKLSERLAELIAEREAGLSEEPTAYFEEKSITELQIPGTYLYKFEACTGDKEIRLGDVYLASDKEIVKAPPELWDRIIEPGTCGIFEIQIRADDPEQIRLFVPHPEEERSMVQAEILSDQPTSPKIQMKQGTLTEDVLCKVGLVLMKKTSDGSAACVSPSTALKLEKRGWGEFV